MRIEMVMPTLDAAGMETVATDLACRLHAKGLEVGVTCIHGEGPLRSRLAEAGIRFSFVPLHGLARNVFPTRMARHLMALGPQIVHSHSGAWLQGALPGRLLRCAATVHTVHGLHDVERWQDMVAMRAGAGFTDHIVAVSRPLQRYLAERIGVRPGKLETILNGVDTERFRPDLPQPDLRQDLGIPGNAIVVGNVARLSPVKDHETLLRAFSIVMQARTDCHLVLVGDGEGRSAIMKLRAELRLESAVHLVGAVDDPAPVYRAFDLFVLSSLAEGTSISILEAMASGNAVVATDVGGNAELLGRGSRGVLVPPRDPARLADGISALLGDEQRRGQLGRDGRSFTESSLSLDTMVDRYAHLYSRLAVSSHR